MTKVRRAVTSGICRIDSLALNILLFYDRTIIQKNCICDDHENYSTEGSIKAIDNNKLRHMINFDDN